MTILDAPLRAVSKSLIGTFGKTITHRFIAGTYDTDTRTVDETPTDETVQAIVEGFEALLTRSAAGQISGSDIRSGDLLVTLAATALSQAPKTKDIELIDGKEYKVVGVDPVYSGDQVTLYLLQVRR